MHRVHSSKSATSKQFATLRRQASCRERTRSVNDEQTIRRKSHGRSRGDGHDDSQSSAQEGRPSWRLVGAKPPSRLGLEERSADGVRLGLGGGCSGAEIAPNPASSERPCCPDELMIARTDDESLCFLPRACSSRGMGFSHEGLTAELLATCHPWSVSV